MSVSQTTENDAGVYTPPAFAANSEMSEIICHKKGEESSPLCYARVLGLGHRGNMERGSEKAKKSCYLINELPLKLT